MKDEYSLLNLKYDISDELTHDYYEYEQNETEIVVRGRLKDNILFLQSIHTSDFILDCIREGYKIPFYSAPPRSFLPNNQSALCEERFVSGAILDLLHKGLVTECYMMNLMFVVHCLVPLVVVVRRD